MGLVIFTYISHKLKPFMQVNITSLASYRGYIFFGCFPPNLETTRQWPSLCIYFFEGTVPIAYMYGIFTYIYHKNQPNLGK